jgi:hypothetical protein
MIHLIYLVNPDKSHKSHKSHKSQKPQNELESLPNLPKNIFFILQPLSRPPSKPLFPNQTLKRLKPHPPIPISLVIPHID